MLFKPFTNAVVIAISLTLLLSACASKPTIDDIVDSSVVKPADEAVVNIDTETTAMERSATLEIEKSEYNAIDSEKQLTVSQSKRVPAVNKYELQQAQQPITVADDVLADYQQAITLMKQKEWQQAQVLLDQIILKQPNLSGGYVNKAIIAKQQDDLVSAQALLNTAININNLNLYAHHLRGQIYREQGQFVQAEQSYLTALDIWPDFSDAQLSMAILLELYRGRLIDAYGYYTSYLLLNSDDEEVKRWQAGLEIKISRAGLAVPVSEEPLALKPLIVGNVTSEPVITESINTEPVNTATENNNE